MKREFEPYHVAWLTAHPHRSAEWLRERLVDGFDVHHIDGNRENNDPGNLVLIDHADHMMLHGGRNLGRMTPRGASKNRNGRPFKLTTKRLELVKRMLAEEMSSK